MDQQKEDHGVAKSEEELSKSDLLLRALARTSLYGSWYRQRDLIRASLDEQGIEWMEVEDD